MIVWLTVASANKGGGARLPARRPEELTPATRARRLETTASCPVTTTTRARQRRPSGRSSSTARPAAGSAPAPRTKQTNTETTAFVSRARGVISGYITTSALRAPSTRWPRRGSASGGGGRQGRRDGRGGPVPRTAPARSGDGPCAGCGPVRDARAMLRLPLASRLR